MAFEVVNKDDQAVLNHCTKHLVREMGEASERWRFPLIESYGDGTRSVENNDYNTVTFVVDARANGAFADVGVVGTFAGLHRRIPLRAVRFLGEDTGFRAVSVKVPKGQVHVYRLWMGDRLELDPINPQQARLDNGQVWSRFFTERCSQPISFERWEWVLLDRLVDHILPFRTREGQKFMEDYYYTLDRSQRDIQMGHAYRLDLSVGVINFIDKLLAREESHRLADYKICLREIDRLLRKRNPYKEPSAMPRDMYIELYNEMSAGQVGGWDYSRYGDPRFFLKMLRRHAFTGAFSHPKYGGNNAACGWAFLAELGRTTDDHSLFDWRRSIEPPLGTDPVYLG